MKKAKIICTIGPASDTQEVIIQLIKTGMNVARLNFSHGTHEYHKKVIENIREASTRLNTPVAILQDLQGIKIRTGLVANGAVQLKARKTILLLPGGGGDQEVSNDRKIFITYPNLLNDVKAGNRVLMDDGHIQMVVKEKTDDGLVAEIKEGGVLKNKKGVNLPDTSTSITPFTEKDQADLAFGIEAGVDLVALSFVKSQEDIIKVREFLKERNQAVPLIAKVEKPEAIRNIKEIIDQSDGIMIARGDLAVELSPVPVLQKELVVKANQAGKVVIVATQMLESMTESMTPTRAEASDVANAVIDGADALMLSAETASGMYPVKAVSVMRQIIEHTEKMTLKLKSEDSEFDRISSSLKHKKGFPYAIADAACKASDDVKSDLIIAFTHSGYTALLLSKNRPKTSIVAFTSKVQIMRQMSLYWGVRPVWIRHLSNTEEMIEEIERVLLEANILKKGDTITIVASSPLSIHGKANFVKLHKLGEGT